MENGHKGNAFPESFVVPKLMIALARLVLFNPSSKMIHVGHMVDRDRKTFVRPIDNSFSKTVSPPR
jgi:hypothetical protein